MFSKFSEEAQKVLLMSKKEMKELRHPYVGSEHLLLAILHQYNLPITKLLAEYQITYEKYRAEIIRVIGLGKTANEWYLYTPLLKRIIENAMLDSKDENDIITVEKIFIALLEEGDGVANRILLGMNIDIDFLYEKFSNKFTYHSSKKGKKLLIEEYAVDFNELYKNEGFDPVIGRDQEVSRLIEILLRRTKNNPLLIGDAGVGKTAIVEELSRRIVVGSVPKKLANKRILSVSMASLVAGTKYRGEFEERINRIIEELEEQNDIILFIDEIHTLVGAGGAEGAIDASNILKPYLARGKLRLIGATTKEEYSKYLEGDKALDRRFQKIYVEEATLKEVEDILFHLRDIYENYHGVFIRDEIISQIVSLSDRYISSGRQPDKAIDLLDEACSKTAVVDNQEDKKIKECMMQINEIKKNKNEAVINHDYKKASSLKEQQEFLENKFNKMMARLNKKQQKKELTLDILYDVIYSKTKIPVSKIVRLDEKSIMKHLNDVVIGQEDAVKEMMTSIGTSRISLRKNPVSLLFVGKSGIGKTLLVKEYAKLLYSKEAFIKIDMSEYKEAHMISKILGSPPGYVGYQDHKSILDQVKRNPYSVILLDEIEKAHPSILKLFLQVLDDGVMTSAIGEVIDFQHVTIFMTSNLGCDKNSIGFSKKEKSVWMEQIKKFLGVELVNRMDGIIMFHDMTEKNIEKIIRKRLSLMQQNYPLENLMSSSVINQIKKDCAYQDFGARKIDKVIDKKIKELLSISS